MPTSKSNTVGVAIIVVLMLLFGVWNWGNSVQTGKNTGDIVVLQNDVRGMKKDLAQHKIDDNGQKEALKASVAKARSDHEHSSYHRAPKRVVVAKKPPLAQTQPFTRLADATPALAQAPQPAQTFPQIKSGDLCQQADGQIGKYIIIPNGGLTCYREAVQQIQQSVQQAQAPATPRQDLWEEQVATYRPATRRAPVENTAPVQQQAVQEKGWTTWDTIVTAGIIGVIACAARVGICKKSAAYIPIPPAVGGPAGAMP